MVAKTKVGGECVDNLLSSKTLQSKTVVASLVQPLQRAENLSSQVYREIERLILSGKLEPGGKVNEYLLAEELGISRAPVREATRALVQSGLLIAVPARGVFVRELSSTEISENYDVRALLTGLLCARAAKRCTPTTMAQLTGMIHTMDEVIGQRDILTYYRTNLAFHNLIAEVADHACSRRIYDDLIRATHFLRRSLHAPAQTNEEHRDILTAIAAGDCDRARQLGEHHVISGKHRWLALLEEAKAQHT